MTDRPSGLRLLWWYVRLAVETVRAWVNLIRTWRPR